jgi:anaerobic selenocysteine-containing dehydrogenase
LRSEPAIIAGLAQALLPPNPHMDWAGWVKDYARIRDAIEQTYPDIFANFNERLFTPGGFHRPLPPRMRIWKTESGKANFIVPSGLDADPDMVAPQDGVLRLMTLRSNDQFNTTIYGFDDRFRGIHGTRQVLFMNAADMEHHALQPDDVVVVSTVADDRVREVSGLSVKQYDIPRGCLAAYYPECNPLVPLWHHAKGSKVPASKSIPVRIRKLSSSESARP